MSGFLTPEESSVFAEETVVTESKVFDETSVFIQDEEVKEPDATDVHKPGDPTEPAVTSVRLSRFTELG